MSELTITKLFILVELENNQVHQLIVKQENMVAILAYVQALEGRVIATPEPLEGIKIVQPERNSIEDAIVDESKDEDIEIPDYFDDDGNQIKPCENPLCENPLCKILRGQYKKMAQA